MPQGPTVRDPAVAPKATRPARKKCAVKAVPLPRVKVVMRRAVPASKSDGYSNKKVILNVPASKSDGPTNKRAILKAPSGYKPTDVGQNLDTDIGESLNTDVEDHSSKESPNMDVGEVYDGPEPMDLDEEYDGPEPMDVDEEEGDGREPIDVNDGREAMDIDSWVDPDEDVDMLDVRNIGSAFNTTITTNTAVTFSALFQPTPTFLTSTVLRAGPAPTPWRSHSLPYARSSRANVFESLKTTQQHKTTSPYVRSAAKPSLAGPIVPLVTPSARALPLKRTAGSAGLAINTRKKPLRR
ncbi:hypothetical protein BG003_007185 [Podila horticola]|nr:hypothetical protein BG003_007185 [Podila horticola]